MRNIRTFRKALAGVILSLPAIGFTADKAVYHVSPAGTASENCGSLQNPCRIDMALSLAQKDGTDSVLLLEPGTYAVSKTLRYVANAKEGSLTLKAKNPSNMPLLKGTSRILNITSAGQVNLEDLRFIGGGVELNMVGADATIKSSEFSGADKVKEGGALVVRSELNGSVKVIGSSFRHNASDKEGGALKITAEEGEVQIINSRFVSNFSRKGGAVSIKMEGNGIVRVLGTTFSKNQGVFTGALNIQSKGMVLVSNSEFMSNQSSDMGGALYISSQSKVTVKKSIFWDNFTGTRGGGALIYSEEDVEMSNNMMVGNFAKYRGGGAFVSVKDRDDHVVVENNIISDNWADEGCNDGDDLYVDADYDYDGDRGAVRIQENIYGENTVISNYNLLTTYGNISGQ